MLDSSDIRYREKQSCWKWSFYNESLAENQVFIMKMGWYYFMFSELKFKQQSVVEMVKNNEWICKNKESK